MDSTPDFDCFTGQARLAVWLAYRVAQQYDHDYLATEHLLSGLLHDGSGFGALAALLAVAFLAMNWRR